MTSGNGGMRSIIWVCVYCCWCCIGAQLFVFSSEILAANVNDVCAISTFFNPFGFSSRFANFVHARTWSARQGLSMLIVELAYDDDPFVLESVTFDSLAHTTIVRRRSNRSNVMWQKEALLNIALDELDGHREFDSCTKVVWLDSDVILEDGWMEATSEMLSRVPLGQPFTHVVRLPKGSFLPFAYWSEPRMERMGYGIAEGQVQWSYAKRYGVGMGGHTGFAWAARRDAILKLKLYDRAIVGGFDALLAHAIGDPRCETRLNDQMAAHFEMWADRARMILGTMIGFPQKTIKAATYWHGENKDRNYQERHNILLRHAYDPTVDVQTGDDGVLDWTKHVSCSLRQSVRKMFWQRQEDGPGVDVNSLIVNDTCETVC